nr:MAG TPA: hypothetical protein [Caudoviricetes sp.]
MPTLTGAIYQVQYGIIFAAFYLQASCQFKYLLSLVRLLLQCHSNTTARNVNY